MGSVLVSPLNWGLGHATRDIPVIRTLLRHGHEVTIAATGNALLSLRQEFPDCQSIDAPDYTAPYGTGDLLLLRLATRLPSLLSALGAERRCIRRITERGRYDLIISDNRLGMFSGSIPSLFVTHQIRFHANPLLWPVGIAAQFLNRLLFRKYAGIIVPDNPPGDRSLAGKLSRPGPLFPATRLYYAGILATAYRTDVAEDLDYLFIVSGPEPQRTVFERIVIPQLPQLPGRKAVLLGSPGRDSPGGPDPDTAVTGYAGTEEKIALMNRAKFIVCRSGYTTMMELAEMKKRRALLIPTPGQTEQEYLSEYYRRQGWFASREQGRLILAADIPGAAGFSGFPDMPVTAGNVERLYGEVLAPYAER